MSIKIAKHVSENFNKKLARTIGLEGKVKILVQFIVDKEGKIFGVKTRSSYAILSNEAKRVIEEIPDLESPGYLDGKPILIPYGFPISFEIENSKKERKRLKNKNKS
ncbi:hypothetical protein FG167_07890 [Lacinutrix sp. WUR7]|uniref:energy transducer TonB n=1 Tax=Lacinutrix sp. WUR7 TaxID=2653681 RepID=UPI00193D9E36|nr:energy transducer TonB [Lacinutrix sp. WUR7]QRM89157.1 hypothetical protein FG167_07890 [Lacinutrix sp. WUR7]